MEPIYLSKSSDPTCLALNVFFSDLLIYYCSHGINIIQDNCVLVERTQRSCRILNIFTDHSENLFTIKDTGYMDNWIYSCAAHQANFYFWDTKTTWFLQSHPPPSRTNLRGHLKFLDRAVVNAMQNWSYPWRTALVFSPWLLNVFFLKWIFLKHLTQMSPLKLQLDL